MNNLTDAPPVVGPVVVVFEATGETIPWTVSRCTLGDFFDMYLPGAVDEIIDRTHGRKIRRRVQVLVDGVDATLTGHLGMWLNPARDKVIKITVRQQPGGESDRRPAARPHWSNLGGWSQ